MSNSTKGILAIIAASTMWGLLGMFYKALAHIPPLEVLAHRTVWSMVFFGIVLVVRGRLGAVKDALINRETLILIGVAAIMIAINWGVFISSIQFGHATEASLGYYIFPLVAVLLGFAFFRDSFSRLQAVAIALIALAVLVLAAGLGTVPWIALILASTFSMYALLKKHLDTGPVVSVFVEVLLLAPFALIWLFGAHKFGWALVDRPSGWFGSNWRDTVMLLMTGPFTAGPLILFSYAAKRVALSTVGLIQYLNPTLQFGVAVLVFGEGITRWHAIALPIIWLALAIYSFDTWRAEKRRSSAPRLRPDG